MDLERENEKEDELHEDQKKIKQYFKDDKKNPYLFNDVNTALDWKHSNPLVVTVKSTDDSAGIKKNFVLNAGEHECCFHFIKKDIVTRCKLTNKLVGIDMDFYRSCDPDGQTAKLINYYHSAGNIPREFMFRRQYFCWTHLSLLTGVRPKIVHSEDADVSLETKLFAVSIIPKNTVFACFCNYRASPDNVQTVFQKENIEIGKIPTMPYVVGDKDSFYFNLFFRDIADYAVADTNDTKRNNAVLEKYTLVVNKNTQNLKEIQYIAVDKDDKTAQGDFIGDIWALKASEDIYGGHGEENHVEIKYYATKVEMENIRLQYYGNEDTIKLNTLDDDKLNDINDNRITGNEKDEIAIDSIGSYCPFVFLLFCSDTLRRLQQVLDENREEEKIDFLEELTTFKEPNLEIIFFLKREGVSENNIKFMINLFKKYDYQYMLKTVTPDEYRSLKKNFLNVYPEHNYQFNYIKNTKFKSCGSIIKYFRLAQNYYTPDRVGTELEYFFAQYYEAVLGTKNIEAEFVDNQYNENIDMMTHVAFSDMPYFKNFREELNIVNDSE